MANAWLLPIQERIGFLRKEGESVVSMGISESLFAIVADVGTEETDRKVENYDEGMAAETAKTVM